MCALCAGLAALASGAHPTPGRQSTDPVERLQAWVAGLERSRAEPNAKEEQLLQQLCADVRLLCASAPSRAVDAARAFLALSIARPVAPAFKQPPPLAAESATARVQAEGQDGLARTIQADPAAARWAAAEILARASAPPAERVACAKALAGLHLPATRLALFACGVDPDRELRAAAIEALCGWPDPGVHRFLIDALRRCEDTPGWIPAQQVRRHFSQLALGPGSAEEREVRDYVLAGLRSPSWKRAYQALEVSAALGDQVAVPDLIEALELWSSRRIRGEGRLRVEGDIARELRRRSGRNIGPHAQRWSTWWKSRQTASPAPEPDPTQITSSSFFGLRPVTDRVVFVIDRSGSMEQPFHTSRRTRYEEATEQLLALLRSLGPEARFRVILFSDETRTWSRDARAATTGNLDALRSWMGSHGPGGGTYLQPAVGEALRLDARGAPALDLLEEDTAVILCDGATAEGPAWVAPFLAGPNEAAGIVFHSVQIGMEGDGTLEALARESGGDFVLIRG